MTESNHAFHRPGIFSGIGMLWFSLLLFSACGGPDVRITNQVKTFGPQWVSTKEKLDAIEKNLALTNNIIEDHFAEFEPSFSRLRDSVSIAMGDSLKGVYHKILLDRESIRDSLMALRNRNEEASEEFDEWERKVMDGDIGNADASTDLRTFKSILSDLNDSADKQDQKLRELVNKHNALFRKLAVMFNSPVHFDIDLKF